jgi:endo-1,4-beta-D-glucanase Y
MMHRRSVSFQTRAQNVALRAALGAGLLAAGVAASGDAQAQTAPRFPFPSSNTAALKTGALTTLELKALYQSWKDDFIDPCGDGSLRVQYPENQGNDTRSEGVGYGMVISAYMGDKTTFDGLLAYWKRFGNGGLMTWKTNDCAASGDSGSASDADVDAALGLIVANVQWGGYAADANTVIGGIRGAELLTCGAQRLLDPGSDGGFGNCTCMNPSYFAPAYYGAYATVDTANAALWTQAVGDAYTTFRAIQDPGSGLVPAWSSNNSPNTNNCNFQVAGGGNPNEYQSDAARVPWRVATDLVWTNSAAARTFLTPMLSWLKTDNRITHIVDRFQTNGSALPAFVQNGGGANNTALNNATLDATGRRSTISMGAFATAGIVGTQDDLDQLVGAWQSLYRAGDNLGEGGAVLPHAFNNSLALLYGMLATGTMWNPIGADPTPVPEPQVVDQPGNLIGNGDFDEGLLDWSFENIGGVAAEGFAMHKAGELHVLLQKVSGVEGEQYMVRLRQPITIQANQNYKISIRARATAPRLLRLFVGQVADPYTTYLALDDDDAEEGAAIHLTDAMQTFEVVQASAAAPQGALQFALDFADSTAEVVIDDISITPTTDPVTAPGTPIVTPPAGDPGTTPPPGSTPGTGPGSTPATGDGNIGPVSNPGTDNTGTPGQTPSGVPGGGEQVAGGPAAPTGVPAATTCSAANAATACAPYACSVPLSLCYDMNTGYVWNPNTNGWTQPPRGVAGCAADQVFWPKFNSCYVPETGWIYNAAAVPPAWQFYGIDYTANKKPEADSGCTVSGAGANGSGSSWMLVGLLGAALGLSYRRRTA